MIIVDHHIIFQIKFLILIMLLKQLYFKIWDNGNDPD